MEGYKAWKGEDEGRRKEKEGEKRRGKDKGEKERDDGVNIIE